MTKVLDSVEWSGQATFKTQPLKPWVLRDDRGAKIADGNHKWNERLAIVNVNEAGHMSVRDQPAATSFVMRKWLSQRGLGWL
jgi:carboxypeptidase C (cathepsin A)